MPRKKAMTSQRASEVKRKGHADAREFAHLLGIGKEYKSDPQAKKDIIDLECINSFPEDRTEYLRNKDE